MVDVCYCGSPVSEGELCSECRAEDFEVTAVSMLEGLDFQDDLFHAVAEDDGMDLSWLRAYTHSALYAARIKYPDLWDHLTGPIPETAIDAVLDHVVGLVERANDQHPAVLAWKAQG